MNESASCEAIARVRRLVDAAGRLAARSDAIVPALVASTGLSAEGVELGLARHLEKDASDGEIAALVASVERVPGVLVILSSNVFVGALRAIALACAAGGDVVVRPSRREPVFAAALVREAADPRLRLAEAVELASIRSGEIHVYGRAATIAAVRSQSHVPVKGHGPGMGIALVTGEPRDAARGLADDVVAFDQRGCLSPRIALVVGDEAAALRFGAALHEELERRAVRVPRGPLPSEDRASADRYVATMTYAGHVFAGSAHAIGVAQSKAPLVLPPSYRHVHVAPCPSIDAARILLAPMESAIIAVGSDDASSAETIAPPVARVSALGAMQRPPFDGPVDRRREGDDRAPT